MDLKHTSEGDDETFYDTFYQKFFPCNAVRRDTLGEYFTSCYAYVICVQSYDCSLLVLYLNT